MPNIKFLMVVDRVQNVDVATFFIWLFYCFLSIFSFGYHKVTMKIRNRLINIANIPSLSFFKRIIIKKFQAYGKMYLIELYRCWISVDVVYLTTLDLNEF